VILDEILLYFVRGNFEPFYLTKVVLYRWATSAYYLICLSLILLLYFCLNYLKLTNIF